MVNTERSAGVKDGSTLSGRAKPSDLGRHVRLMLWKHRGHNGEGGREPRRSERRSSSGSIREERDARSSRPSPDRKKEVMATRPRPSLSHHSRTSQLPIEVTHAGRGRKRTREVSPVKTRPRRKRSPSSLPRSGPEVQHSDHGKRLCHEKRQSEHAAHREGRKEHEYKGSVPGGEATVGASPTLVKVNPERLVPPLPAGGHQRQPDDFPSASGSSPPHVVCRISLTRIRPPVAFGDAPAQLPLTFPKTTDASTVRLPRSTARRPP